MPNGMRLANAPTRPIGSPDLTGAYGGGQMLTEWSESVPDLTWPESVRTYARMRRDPKITAVLRAMFLPIIRATWAVDPEGIDNDESVQLVASDLGLPVLGEKNNPRESPIKGFSFADHIRLALLNLVYGHMPFEHWFELRDGRTHLAGLQERLPQTIAEMDIGDDGQMTQVWQTTHEQPIPAEYLMWYTNEREGANWAGTSLLRPCYTPWVLKHETLRVHATSIRRFGMGVPNVVAPVGATPAQIAEAQRLASGMRAGDETGAGLPAGYEFRLTGLTGAAPDAIGFLGYLDQQITGSALASIIELAHSTYGSKALGESFLDLFLLALQAAADLIGETATFGSPTMPGVSRALTEYNFGEGEPIPKIVCADVGDRHEITATSVQLLISCGALTPDPVLEAFLRNAWGLPEKPEPAGPEGTPAVPGAGAPGGGPPPAPAPAPEPPAPGGQLQDSGLPVAARRQGGRRHRHAGAAPFRPHRALTAVEAAAGLDPDGIAAELNDATDRIAGQWAAVLRAQHQDLAYQVGQAVDGGDLAALGDLAAPPAGGPELLTSAMTDMAWTAARRAIGEAAVQGVTIDPATIAVDEDRLGQIAQARAGLAGQQLAHAASRRALRVVQATAGDDAAEEVQVTLGGLSTTPLADQLRAAMSAAQNQGRAAVYEQAEEQAGPGQGPTYVATEVGDTNTCGPCLAIDGTEFDDLDAAVAAYANGAYIDCEGELRCRGTFFANWDDVSPSGAGDGQPDGSPDTPPDAGPALGEDGGPSDTWDAYYADAGDQPPGTWDSERAQLHDQIIDDLLAGYQRVEEPDAYLLLGGPGSGVEAARIPGGGIAPIINPELLRRQIPEYSAYLSAGDARAAALVDREAAYLSSAAARSAADRGINYALAGTGNVDPARIEQLVAAARAGGAQNVLAHYFYTDPDQALANIVREAGRTLSQVPGSISAIAHEAVKNIVTQQLQTGVFDQLNLWNAGIAPPTTAVDPAGMGTFAEVMAILYGDRSLDVLDRSAFDRFVARMGVEL
jgi:Zeta toxin